ncbi:hypothetical protein OG459_22270 [Streptomyces canus]
MPIAVGRTDHAEANFPTSSSPRPLPVNSSTDSSTERARTLETSRPASWTRSTATFQ